MGRIVTGDNIYAFGYWSSDDYLKGYGKRIRKGKLTEGHWNGTNYLYDDTTEATEITAYDPFIDIIGRKVENEKYEI